MALQLQTAADGVVRDAHYVIPTGASEPVRTLLTEPQRTNLLTDSQDFAAWTNVSACAVTTNAAIAPDGTATADLLTATVSGSRRVRNFTVATDGTKCAVVFLKQSSGALTRLWYANSSDTVRHRLSVTWSGGVPTVSTQLGAGTIYPVENYGDGWYKIAWAADGVVAAETQRIVIQPDQAAGVGSVLCWGAQAEDAVVPSSYIPTEATTVTRNADSLYWAIAGLTPRESTFYQRHVNVGAFANTGALRLVGHAGDGTVGSGARLEFGGAAAGAAAVSATYSDGTTPVTATATASPTPVLADVVEVRVVISSTWTVTVGVSVNGGTEVTATSTASGPAAAYSAARYYLAGLSASSDLTALTHTAIALGTKTRAEMRAIAGVS